MTAQTDDNEFATYDDEPPALPAPLAKLFEALGDEAAAKIADGIDVPFPALTRRSEAAMAAIHRFNRTAELDFLYRQWIDKEVTLGYVQTVADLTEEEAEILYRGRDKAMRIDRLGRVTYDEPTLLRAVCAVVGG